MTYVAYAPMHNFLIWLVRGWTLIGPAPGHHGSLSVIVAKEFDA